MTIESKDLLVAIKAFSRGEALPLDVSEVQESLAAAQKYADSAIAYPGQTVKILINGEYVSYVLQPSSTKGKLELKRAGLDSSDIKTLVEVVDSLPTVGQEQGVLYINASNNKGYIYNDSKYQVVFEEVENLPEKLSDIEKQIETKANKTDVYTKTEADAAIQTAIADSGHLKRVIVDTLPNAVDADENVIYMVPKVAADADNQHYDEYMVFTNSEGTKQFEKIGDTQVDLTDYATIANVATAKQEAIDAASSDATTKASATLSSAKTYADGLASNYDAAGKADSALEEAKKYANSKSDASKVYIDGLVADINTTLATKITLSEAQAAINTRIGDIDENTTVKGYVDSKVSDIETDYTESVNSAKEEAIAAAKEYTNNTLTITEFQEIENMANIMKVYTTVATKLSSLPVQDGQLIFVSDTRQIYLDFSGTRVSYNIIQTFNTDEDRATWLVPVEGFYFVKSTGVLWNYSSGWTQLSPDNLNQIFFGETIDDFPTLGNECILYITDDATYKWDVLTGSYKMVSNKTEWDVLE